MTDAQLTPQPPRQPTKRELHSLADNPWQGVWKDILGGNAVRSALAIILALLIGSLIVVLTDTRVADAAGYFFAKPGDTFAAIGEVIGSAYSSIFQGAIYSPRAGFAPFLSTLQWATPLIAAGLGLGVSFRAGLFNIGGQGQILAGALFASWVGASVSMPIGLHFVVTLLAALAGASIWAAMVGWLKAQTGAHEVILTIMFNWIAFYGITLLLKTPLFQAAGAGGHPKSKPMMETAVMPSIGGISIGFAIVLLAAVAYWWIMDRSTIGFRIRAVGINPNAASTAGINVKTVTLVTMAISGAFIGLAAATQVQDIHRSGFTPGVHAGIGFDAITVALLGGNNPVGIVFAGILFGALKAGSYQMEIVAGIPKDIIPVIQGLIVLFIAAPPLIRGIFHLPTPSGIRLADRLRARADENANNGKAAS